MMQVTRAAFQTVANLNEQATDPKSHTLVKSLLQETQRYRYLLIPMVDLEPFERGRPPSDLDQNCERRYKVFMKTLTITDAKKNLGRWLAAAARGEDIGIVCGSDIVALRKVEVESTDYAQREYGALPEQVAALEKATDQRYRRLKRGRKLISVTTGELRKMLE